MSTELKTLLGGQIPEKAAALKAFAKEHGNKSLGEVTIAQCLGGARGVKCMTWETSLLDAEEGIRFRGHTIPDLQEKMPGPTGGEPTPEALLWLLFSSEIPTQAQSAALTADLHERAAKLPAHVETMIRAFPKGMHPMTQFSSAILAMQTESQFAKAYSEGVSKNEYWDTTYEDILNCIACLPEIAALIYRCTYHDGVVAKADPSLDYSANFARMLGYNDPEFDELMRMYLVIHSDHEGGNASAHATHLVGSTLSDPYLSLSGGMNALAGPLHGLANQEVLKWIQDLKAKFEGEGKEVNKETITEFAWETLNAGRVIPGYGHAVLRKTDPRYMAQREFALKYMADDELFKVRAHFCLFFHAVLVLSFVFVCSCFLSFFSCYSSGCFDHLRSHAGRADRARKDQEPVPERRLSLWHLALEVRFHGVRVLHRALRRESRVRRTLPALLGPRP